MSGLATETYVDDAIAAIPVTDLTGLATVDSPAFTGSIVLSTEETAPAASSPGTTLPLNVQVQVLSNNNGDGAYYLGDGVEGQMMHFVVGSAGDTFISVRIANARWYDSMGGAFAEATDFNWLPFSAGSGDNPSMASAIFANGCWTLSSSWNNPI